MRRTLLAVPALLVLLATTGCASLSTAGAPSGAGQSGRSAASSSASSDSSDSLDSSGELSASSDDDEVDQLGEETEAIAEELRELWYQDEVEGSAPQIALRFLQALQRGDDLAAARELTSTWRITDAWQLHRVMSDVRRHARLAGAGRCTRAIAFRREQVIVACGSQRVMVQAVAEEGTSGVNVFDEPPTYWDTPPYRHPHTWAYTTVPL